VAYTLYSDIPNFSAAAVNAAAAFIDREFYNDDILTSPVVVRSARFDALAQAGSADISVPFLNPLDAAIEENTANLDPSVMAAIHGITGGTQKAKLNYKDQVFGSDRITSTLRGIDVMPQIASRLERYWIERRKKHVTTILSALALTVGFVIETDAVVAFAENVAVPICAPFWKIVNTAVAAAATFERNTQLDALMLNA
jgi:hypothetical protein